MYQLFDFEKRDCIVQGYHFPCEAPHHVVCLIHGIGEHAGRFSRMADYFHRAGIAVVSMDLRGHGRSQGVRGACAPRAEVLRDIDALIEYAREFYPIIARAAAITMCRPAISFLRRGSALCVRSAADC